MENKKKKTVLDFQKMKGKEKAAAIVCYDAHTAQRAEETGVDWILAGDSVGMSIYGYPSTVPVTMEQTILHAQADRIGAPNTFLVGDMPFGSYQLSVDDAVKNAVRFYKEAGVDAIKLEGGVRVAEYIRAIVNAGINVMGHIGLTPQSSGQLGGFKVQGATCESAIKVIEDALAVEKAGAFALLVEAVPPEVTNIISLMLKIPVYSIGAGPHCDGQLLLEIDLLGRGTVFSPKFCKKYGAEAIAELLKNPKIEIKPNEDRFDLSNIIRWAFQLYVKEVKTGAFPDIETHCYKMVEGEYEKLKICLKQTIEKKLASKN